MFDESYPYRLIQMGIFIPDYFAGEILHPTIHIDQYPEVWEEIVSKYNDDIGTGKKFGNIFFGDVISDIVIGENFFIRSDSFLNNTSTSQITRIISDEIFFTYNSVYYLLDVKQKQRDNKIDQILK